MKAKSSALILEQSMVGFRGRLTAADAAARSGLPTREAAEGLALLGAECGGHLAVTEKGELIYDFPRGFVRSKTAGLARRIGRTLVGAATALVRLLVRAWLSVVMIGYAIIFAVVLIVIAAKSDDGPIGEILGLFVRTLFEALYWTFHPLSPVFVEDTPTWAKGRRAPQESEEEDLPFYEKVNRFVFGPSQAAPDPMADMAKAVVEIRRLKGRVVPADILRVFGGSRQSAEAFLLRLVADHDGEITVSDEGAIVYEFPQLRSTAHRKRSQDAVPAPVWTQLATVPPLTGNSGAFNVFFAAVNTFNLVMSGVVLAHGLTIDRIFELISRMGVRNPPPLSPPDSAPLALGWVPFLFSLGLFVIPLLRWSKSKTNKGRVDRDNRVRLLLRRLLLGKKGAVHDRPCRLSPAQIAEACTVEKRRASGPEGEQAVFTLGGTIELDDEGTLMYAFDDLARENDSVKAARDEASPDEAQPGQIIFSSADEGHGIRGEPNRPKPSGK